DVRPVGTRQQATQQRTDVDRRRGQFVEAGAGRPDVPEPRLLRLQIRTGGAWGGPPPAGGTCPNRACFVCRYARLRRCAAVVRARNASTATPLRARPSAFAGLLDSSRTDRTPRARSTAAASP